MEPPRTFMFVGTTAELIKLVPVIRELNRRKIVFTIIASGQNDIHFEEFASEIGKPTIVYAVTPKGKEPSLLLFAVWAVRTFFSLLKGLRGFFIGLDRTNSLFLVHGDTVSSLMGALVARIYGLKLVHIESGLRSYDFFEPFPEELCRYVISRIAHVHFCPNAWAVNNLRAVQGEKINTHQNTLFETFQAAMKLNSNHPLVLQLKKQKKKYFVLVVHRQEHVLFGKSTTTRILEHLLSMMPKNMTCIFLVHDLSADFIHALSSVIPQEVTNRMMRISRLAYGDFMHLINGAEFMITDGGSNQEEMYYMGKPCLILRNYTERIEGLHKNILLSQNKKAKIAHFIHRYKRYRWPRLNTKIRPSKIIINHLFGYEK